MKIQRRNEILKMLSKDRMVKSNKLLEVFQVSMETIRRDLEFLEKKGFISKVYGGAVLKTMYGIEPDYRYRKVKNYEKKVAIGREASKLVVDGDTIIIDVGTTTLEFAKFLHNKKQITVFTNAVQIAIELTNNVDIRVVLLGGVLRGGEYSTSGFLAEDMMNRFHVDKVFLGVEGYHTQLWVGRLSYGRG